MPSLFPWKRLSLAVAFVMLCLLALQTRGFAMPGKENPKHVSWHISALMVTYDKNRELYIAEDDVVITGGATRLEADYLEFSDITKEAFAQGNVLFISGGDTITCNAMQVNLATHKGSINKGTIFIQEGNYYITGEKMRKTGQFTYDAAKGSITTCDGDSPDWKITGRNIKVTIEGYGTASHTALWAKKLPVLYSPYLVFPVKTKRQTGLLLPYIGSSDRRGFEYEQPLFLALSRNTDATVYAHYMSDRGVKTAGEFRYVIDDQSRGAIMMDFLEDDKIDDGTDARQTYGFSSTDTRTNTDRWWFRMKHDQVLPYGVTAKLDLDVVSDADYLQEFQDGFTGYDATNEYFSDAFGRSLDSYDDTTRKNSLLLSKTWSSYSMSVQGLWYDDVEARQQDTTDTTLQTLPSVEFDALRQKIGDTSFYWTLDSETRSFYRQDTTDKLVSGQRLDIYPKLYYPTRIGKHFSFEPYLGVRGTGWHTNDFTDDYGNDDEFRFRGIYDTGASLSTTIDRVFNLDAGFAEKLKHEIIPQIDYAFRPNEVQDDLPYFDGLDRIGEQNVVTWSLTHVFTARTTLMNTDNQTQGHIYKELAWFKFYQDYDIKNERDNESASGRPWQDVKLKYELNPSGFLSSNGDIAVNPYNGHFTQVKIGATISDNRGDKFYSSYRYDIDDYQTWVNRLTIQITDEVMTYYCLESDLEDRSTVEQKAGVELTRDCWGMKLEIAETSGEKTIAFLVLLKGIGEFGTQ